MYIYTRNACVYHTVSLQRVMCMDHANLVLLSDIYIYIRIVYKKTEHARTDVCLSLFIPNERIRERETLTIYSSARRAFARKKNKTENRIVPH